MVVPAQPSTTAPSDTHAAIHDPRRNLMWSPSGELDVDRTLVLPAVGVQERDLQRPRLRRAKGEREERILADRLRRLRLEDLPAVVGDDDLVDEEVVLVDGLAVAPL